MKQDNKIIENKKKFMLIYNQGRNFEKRRNLSTLKRHFKQMEIMNEPSHFDFLGHSKKFKTIHITLFNWNFYKRELIKELKESK